MSVGKNNRLVASPTWGPYMADRKSNATREALDELAALFLTPAAHDIADDAPAPPTDDLANTLPPPPSRRAAPRANGFAQQDDTHAHRPQPDALAISAVVLGHLPGFASPWITQYADALARHENASVALLYIEPGSVRIDLVKPDAQPDDAAPAPLQAGSLDDAIAELATRARHALLVVDDPESDLGRRCLAHLDEWTLLSAADEAAVVGAYRLLKSLRAGAHDAGHQPAVQVAFAGSSREQANEALARLARATTTHLHLPLAMGLVRQRIEPARRHHLGAYETDADPVVPLFTALDRVHRAGPPSHADEPAVDREPTAPPSADVDASSAHAAATDMAEHALPREEPAADAQPLAGYVDPPLTPLGARCPRCRAVALAVDAEGRLHLLRRSDSRTAADTAIIELIEARAWAIEHAELLALTCDRVMIDTVEPQLHLFTAEPAPLLARLNHAAASARRLLRLHLLKPVKVADHTTHLHAPLT